MGSAASAAAPPQWPDGQHPRFLAAKLIEDELRIVDGAQPDDWRAAQLSAPGLKRARVAATPRHSRTKARARAGRGDAVAPTPRPRTRRGGHRTKRRGRGDAAAAI